MAAALPESLGERGLVRSAGRAAAVLGAQISLPLTRVRRRNDRFSVRGAQLPYTFGRYNNAFLNERAVEISIAKWFLGRDPGRMLEVGNVLSHYGVTGHTVLDKYEEVPGVRNEDIVDFRPETPYDTVVAISTLEHVGWDETPREPDKVLRAMRRVKECATAGGRVLVTVPTGYHPRLDRALRTGELRFPQEHWLVRTNRRNDWVEADRDVALDRDYGRPYTGANGLYVGMVNA